LNNIRIHRINFYDMNTLNSPRLLTLTILCALVFSVAPDYVAAIGIGELTLSSKLGQPLAATVDTQPTKGENIEDACLAIVAIDESSRALIQTGLSIRFNKDSHKIEISSKRPFNEPYAAFGLHIQCKGLTKSSFKALSFLPDFESNPVSTPIVAPKTSLVAIVVPKVEAVKPPLRQNEQAKPLDDSPRTVEPVPNSKPKSKKQELATSAKASSVQIKSEFQLQLSDGELDISRGGIMSAVDREFITAHRSMLNEDDQNAHQLAMQYQMKLMSEEIKLIRQKLASQEIAKVAAKKAETLISSDTWGALLKALAGLVAIGLAGFGVLYYRKMWAHRPKSVKVEAETIPTLVKSVGESTMSIVHPAGSRQFQAIRALQDDADAQLQQSSGEEILSKEEQTVLEEAELYAVYGHSDKAIRILLEFLVKFPKSEHTWMLLLSVYSSNEQISEFENASQKFLSHNDNSPYWKTIQALGRTLDRDNVLYHSENTEKTALWLPSNTTKKRLIGKILIELGYLSSQDMANCLGEFDSKQHGRFGSYLLMRRMINHTQLNEALLLQQSDDGYEVETKESAEWQPEDTTPNLVEHHTFATPEHVQDKAFPLDLVIDDKLKLFDETLKHQSVDGFEVELGEDAEWRPEDTTPNMDDHQAFAALEHVQDKAFPLDFVIDDQPKLNGEALPKQQSDDSYEVEAKEATNWQSDETTPNMFEHHMFATPEHVQDKELPLDLVIEDQLKSYDEEILKPQSVDIDEEEAKEVAEWQPDDTTPNMVNHHAFATPEDVQNNVFALDLVADDKLKFTDEEMTIEVSTAEENAPSEVEDKAQPLAFHLDFEPTPASSKPQDS
jgi:hypothetical protein